ncbi:MAG: TAXI family TRAP transporter solute-binding subunit [Burkholderiaceae bacterium]
MSHRFSLASAVLATCAFAAQPAAAEPELPETMAWSAYDVGSGGYSQVVGIASAFKTKYGVNLRIIPGKNDVSRILPLKTGQLDFVANGSATYMQQEGVFEFGARDWGPMPVRILLTNIGDFALPLIVAADTGVKTVADLKGKRVSWVIGSPALQKNTAALLAFGGLTWDDVEKVEFGGYGAGLKGIVNGQVDAAFANSLAGITYELAQSPRGVVYPPMPASDTEGWQRVLALAPFFVPVKATDGAGLSKEQPIELSMIPYPILTTLVDRKAADVYAVMRAMDETYPLYKDSAPGNGGWALERQNLEWVVPYHEGAIRYFEEKGLWNATHQAHNDGLIRRQEVLAEAWSKLLARNLEGKEHIAAWQGARADALREAGMEVGIEDW